MAPATVSPPMPESKTRMRWLNPSALPLSPRMAAAQARDHAAQRPHCLLGELGAQEQVAHVAHHAGLLLGRLVETRLIEISFQMVEKAFELVLRGGAGVGGAQSRRLDGGELGGALADRGGLDL